MTALPAAAPAGGYETRTQVSSQSQPLYMAWTAASLTMLVILAFILKLNHGTFTYSMDDPYIALAVSDTIRHGGYGMSLAQHSAPSSSILFPLLEAPASGTPMALYWPLLLNLIGLFATLYILHRFLLHLRVFPSDRFGTMAHAVTLCAVAACLNLIAVVFTGMEHSLHIALTAACIYGLALFLDDGRIPAWLPWALILAPLLRYEGLALSLGVLLVFYLRGQWRTARLCFAAIAICLVSFSVFLVSMKLPPLPSSVLVKSAVMNGVEGVHSGLLHSVWESIFTKLVSPIGVLLFVALFEATIICVRDFVRSGRRLSSRGLMALALICMAGGHIVAGRMGWLYRYEDYVMLGTLMAAIYLLQDPIRAGLSGNNRLTWMCAAAGAVIFFAPYIKNTLETAEAANNIYDQQFQMTRFVRGYWHEAVAANDLGILSWGSPYQVLDIRGLASERARNLWDSHAGPDAYRELVDGAGVKLAILYDQWFAGRIPGSWRKVASMDLSRPDIAPAEPEVQFYATDASAIPELVSDLKAFAPTLPHGVRFKVYENQAGAAVNAVPAGPVSGITAQ